MYARSIIRSTCFIWRRLVYVCMCCVIGIILILQTERGNCVVSATSRYEYEKCWNSAFDVRQLWNYQLSFGYFCFKFALSFSTYRIKFISKDVQEFFSFFVHFLSSVFIYLAPYVIYYYVFATLLNIYVIKLHFSRMWKIVSCEETRKKDLCYPWHGLIGKL